MATYTGSVTLTNINDGADADSYHLSSNIEGFQKHYEYDQNGNEVVIFSDDIIEFYLEHSVNEQSQPVNPNNYYTSLSTLENSAFYGEYNYTTEQAWLQDYDTLYIKVGNDYKRNVDSEYHSSWTYYIDLLAGINDLWDLFEHINVIDENEIDTTTLLNKVFFKNIDNNSTDFNLYNSLFYPVDENLNLVDGQPSKYIVALKNYRDFVEQQNAYFILKAFEDENLTQLYDYKVFFVEYVVNLNFARFALTATNIQASVDNSTMIFDGEGLTIYDGGLTIKQSKQYVQTEDPERLIEYQEWQYNEREWRTSWNSLYIYNEEQGIYEINQNEEYDESITYYAIKKYFIYEDKQYKEYSGDFTDGYAKTQTQPNDWSKLYYTYYTYDPTTEEKYIPVPESENVPTWVPDTYYRIVYEIVPESDLLKYDIDNKRLNIKGSGEFTGTIYATDGVFSGTIAAMAGSIGGFDIGDNALISKAKDSTFEFIPWTYDESQWPTIKDSLYVLNDDDVYVLNTDPVYHDNITYYLYSEIPTETPLIQLLGTEGRIIAKNINLGTGVVIDEYIKLGNSYIYNPLNHNNSFIDIKDIDNKSILEFRADGTGKIGEIHINGNSSRLNGINWWISPDKASFSNIDVTGTIHTSVFETGRIQSVGGSMIFKEGARVQSVETIGNDLTLTLETKMGLKPGSIVLCTTNDSDYTDTSLSNQLNFYGKIISSTIAREYRPTEDVNLINNKIYYIKESEDKYRRFTGDNFYFTSEDMTRQQGKTYYIQEGDFYVIYNGDFYELLQSEPDEWATQYFMYYTYDSTTQVYTQVPESSEAPSWSENTYYERKIIYEKVEPYELFEDDQKVVIDLEPDAAGYENLISQIIQLGDNVFNPTEDRSRYTEWDYNHSAEPPEDWDTIYNTLYIKTNDIYTLINKKPNDWEENYYKYYIQNENENYELVGSNESRVGYGVVDQAELLSSNIMAPEFVLNTYYVKSSIFVKNEDSNYNSQTTYYVNNNKEYYVYEALTDSLSLYTGNDLIQGTTYFEKELDYTNNLIIGVNATEHINKMLYPEGFTFIKFDGLKDNINPTYANTPILFLGNLDGLNDENITGYGLYGENVFLTGSLTTRYNSEETFKYAGVNTLSGAVATIFEEGNYFPGETLPENDKIIFWAGSDSTAAEDVQASPFQVTENGYFYASHGVFEGSIFVRATIEASELRTASIYGTGDAPALKIYNTSIEKLGIHFYEHNGELDYETLRLTSAGFSNDQGTSYFINIDGNRVNFNGNNITGNVFYTIPVNNSQLEMIGTNFNVYQYNQEGSANIYRFINFNPDNQFYEIKYDDANRILQDKQNGELTLFSGSTKVSTNLSLGGKIDYKQAIEEREEGNQIISELIGYDLFVR